MADIEINDVIPRNRYVATGGEPSFFYTYPIFDADHLVVKETNPADLDNPVTLVRGLDYEVTGVGVETGGTVVFKVGEYPTGAIAADIYTIYRQIPYERLNDYQFSGDFESSDVNTDFDSIVMMTQQLNRDLQSTIRLDETDPLTSLPITVETAAARGGRALTFAADGMSVGAGPSAQDIEDGAANAALAQAGATQSQGYRDEALVYRNEAQAAAAGMKRKTPARAATTGALPSSNYANGAAGVGATITATANGAWSSANSDTVALVVGEAIVVKNEGATLRNGTYVLTQQGSAGTPWILTRQTDSDTWSEIVAAIVTITEGATFADVDFLCTSNNGGTMGTTAITWQQQNSVIGDGAVSTAAKIANGIITFAKMATAALAIVSDIRNAVASKLVDAATLWSFFSTYNLEQTAVVTLSGTAIDLSTAIAAGAKRIEILIFEASLSGTSDIQVQLGTAGSYETSGYLNQDFNVAGSLNGTTNSSIGFRIITALAAALVTGRVILTKIPGTNTWIAESIGGQTTTPRVMIGVGSKIMPGALTRIRLTSSNGSDTFDNGVAFMNIEY